MYLIHASFDRVLTLSRAALIDYDKRMLGLKQKLLGHMPGCAGAWLRHWSREVRLLLSYESLALQDYINKAPDDELATIQCLDVEA